MNDYRQYENPHELEHQLEIAKNELFCAIYEGVEDTSCYEEIIANLKDRIRFAWDDNEYDNQEDY